ncbi:MAG: hypothetical protein JWM86_1631 [Thermoleophilia bacterium]|nr:hypothetical protein [Thermoleophilia bacterium]
MAIKGFSAAAAVQAGAAATKAPGLLKWGGIAAAIGGLALTGIGFKAKGVETGTKATEATAVQAINALTAQYEQTMSAMAAQKAQEIQGLKAKVAAAGQQGGGAGIDPATGLPTAGAGAGQGQTPVGGTGTPGAAAGSGVVLGEDGKPSETAPIVDGATPGVGIGLNTTVVPTTGTAAAAGGATQAMLGSSVNLAAGQSGGAVIAEAGNYKIEQLAGDPAGYATLEEANSAARATMSTELMGSKFLRWMVVEQGGRFYGVIAKQLAAQEPAKPLPATAGNVVAWSAMNHVAVNGTNGWKAYAWTKTGGEQITDVPYGTSAVFGGGPGGAIGGPATVPAGTGAGAGSAPIGGTNSGAVTGGGQVAQPGVVAGSFDPASAIGRSFAVNASTTAEGDLARGGALQVQKFIEASTGGFGTPEEAATVARQARAAIPAGDAWSRITTLQGADGRYYVYQGSIVKRETAAIQNAAPLHVFGAGFSEFFDSASNSWRAVRDAA